MSLEGTVALNVQPRADIPFPVFPCLNATLRLFALQLPQIHYVDNSIGASHDGTLEKEIYSLYSLFWGLTFGDFFESI